MEKKKQLKIKIGTKVSKQQLQNTQFSEWDSKNSACCLMPLYVQNIVSNLSSTYLKYNGSVNVFTVALIMFVY